MSPNIWHLTKLATDLIHIEWWCGTLFTKKINYHLNYHHLDGSRPKSTSPKFFTTKIWHTSCCLVWHDCHTVKTPFFTHLVVCRINQWQVLSSCSSFLFCIFPNLLNPNPTSVGLSSSLLRPFSLIIFSFPVYAPPISWLLPLCLPRLCFLYSWHFNAIQTINVYLSISQSCHDEFLNDIGSFILF